MVYFDECHSPQPIPNPSLTLMLLNNKGMVYFDELARIAVMAKTCPGEEGGKIVYVGERLYQLRTTPFVELHREAKARNLRVTFRCLDIRESSDVGLPVHVSELLISGIWEEVKDGRIVKKFAVKQFQGIGHSFRQAKYQAAAAGLLILNKAVLPGAHYAPGTIPEEWTHWTNENLLRGVDPLMLVHILKTKSFQPNLNIALLHKIIAWIFFDDFLTRYPRFKKEYLVGHVGEDTLEEEIVRGRLQNPSLIVPSTLVIRPYSDPNLDCTLTLIWTVLWIVRGTGLTLPDPYLSPPPNCTLNPAYSDPNLDCTLTLI